MMNRWLIYTFIVMGIVGGGYGICMPPSQIAYGLPENKTIEDEVTEYLVKEKGYSVEDFSYVRGERSYVSDEYIAYVGFEDEPGAIYGYGYNQDGKMSQIALNFYCVKHYDGSFNT